MLREISQAEFLNSIHSTTHTENKPLEYLSCVFKKMVICKKQLLHINFLNCVFEEIIITKSFLANLSFCSCKFTKVYVIDDCELKGIHVVDSAVINTLIKDSLIGRLNVVKSKIAQCYLTKNLIYDISLQCIQLSSGDNSMPDSLLVLKKTNYHYSTLASEHNINYGVKQEAMRLIEMLSKDMRSDDDEGFDV